MSIWFWYILLFSPYLGRNIFANICDETFWSWRCMWHKIAKYKNGQLYNSEHTSFIRIYSLSIFCLLDISTINKIENIDYNLLYSRFRRCSPFTTSIACNSLLCVSSSSSDAVLLRETCCRWNLPTNWFTD